MDELKVIKKRYGENFMHLCRDLFPQILEREGLLTQILDEHFAYSRNLYNDLISQGKVIDFKNYIYSFVDVENKGLHIPNKYKSAVELMAEAGYILYPECKTEEEIQAFKKWYAKGEALCTFRGGRLNDCRVWFAVANNAGKIRREDFKNPERQDLYGVSVISIQFTRGDKRCSIKNRYNHTVNNPDNTFNSNLDKILPGLADAFERDFGVRDIYKTGNNFEMNNYVCVDGKYYHYTHEMNNVYYCDGNCIIDNFRVKELPLHQMLMEYFIVDFKEKTIECYDKHIEDCLPKTIGKIKKMAFENGVLTIINEENEKIEIGLSSKNEIVSYKNEKLKECGDYFLLGNKELKELNLPELQKCGDDFLLGNKELQELNLPKLRECGDEFLLGNKELKELNLPELQKCGNHFLFGNKELEELNFPELRECGYGFLYYNEKLKELNLPNLCECGDDFLYYNEELEELTLPELREYGGDFLLGNKELQELNLPKLRECGDEFLLGNKELKELNLPELQKCGNHFLFGNKELEELNFPELRECGYGFLYYNEKLKELNLPNLCECGDDFLYYNEELEELTLPELREYGGDFLYWNQKLQKLNLPKLQECGNYFLYWNQKLQKLNLPKLQECGNYFLFNNKKLEELTLPELRECGDYFLFGTKELKELTFPELQKCGDYFLCNNKKLQKLTLPELRECGDDFLFGNQKLKKLNLPKLQKINYEIEMLFKIVKENQNNLKAGEDEGGEMF